MEPNNLLQVFIYLLLPNFCHLGIVASQYSVVEFYRIYAMATPEYRGNFPITNGKATDDTQLLIFLKDMKLGGEWANMQIGKKEHVQFSSLLFPSFPLS